MANYLTVSTVAPRPPEISRNTPCDKAADQMVAFWRERIEQVLPDNPDLIVLPEQCDRPSRWNNEQSLEYFELSGPLVGASLAELAKANRCYVTYPHYRKADDGAWRNSTVLLDRNGAQAGVYNKNHLVIEENEVAGALYGRDAPVIECDFGRVACAVCFDLNFDELRLRYAQAQPDIILFSSMYHGGLMQAYWAYSCGAFFVASVSGLPSAILAPTGETVADATNYFDHVTATINLDCVLCHLDYNWEKLAAAKRKYAREVTVHDPGFLGVVLVSSETPKRTAREIVNEFEIELRDDYFARARAHRGLQGKVES